MRRTILKTLAILAITAWSGATALGCYIVGSVACPNDRTFAEITVTVSGNGFTETQVVGPDGLYMIHVPIGGRNYTVTLGNLPDGISEVKYQIGGGAYEDEEEATVFAPVGGTVAVDWLIDGPACGSCWMTGGGAYVDPLLGIATATRGGTKTKPLHSFGGNVYPGCSPTAGDGGNWNHVARGRINLHFHGTSIRVIQCGNVTPPPPPGSTSPITPFNFIEFEGTGWLKGVHGNKVNYPLVQFVARVEDHNEPGSHGAREGALIDRYYLRVFTADGDLLVISDPTGDEQDWETLTIPITDGNLQLHISSCDNPPGQSGATISAN